ncbi:MAG TPA: LysM peptidoglycan-binding domain-containing protein [Longimicrobiaceae bacterium]|nr:LysM peptidoglycan-binding domain-containing protein [Longimicrobiaceae bacterium]
MKRAALAAAAAALAAAGPLAAQQDTVPEGRVHVVRPGDTLWDIARQYLADPFLWPDIFRLNTDVVRDPARIYPNERLVLPPGVRAVSNEGRTVFYDDSNTRDRTVLDAEQAPHSIVREGDFYSSGYLAHNDEVSPLGRVEEVVSPTVVPLERQPTIQVYDKVFLSLDPRAQVRIGDRVQFLQAGRELRGFGRVWMPTAIATVANVDGTTATAVVIRMFNAVTPGDLVVPVAAFPVDSAARPAASSGLQGKIVAFQRVHPVQSNEEIAFLDVGRQAGVKEGDVFEVFLPRARRDWGTRPEIPVGRLQVVKVMNGTASARITHLEQPAIAVGQPVRRIAAMP